MKANLVLCYHRVSDVKSGGTSLLAVDKELFEWQIKFLKRKFQIETLENCIKHAPSKKIAITFDDGYADNVKTALPILINEDVPATFFIATDYLNSKLLYLPDLLDEAFRNSTNKQILFETISKLIPNLSGEVSDYWSAHNLIRDLPKPLFIDTISALSDEFSENVLLRDPLRRAMTISEIRTLASTRGMQIGGHTSTHRRLAGLDPSDFELEIENCQNELVRLKLLSSDFFAIPYGTMDDFTLDQVEKMHGKGLLPLSTVPIGISSTSRLDIVPRLCVQNWTKTEFKLLVLVTRLAAYMPKTWLGFLSVRRHLISSLGELDKRSR